MQYLSAVMWVESGGREDAISPKNAVGIMQVTQAAAIHTISLCPAIHRGSAQHNMRNLMLSSVNIRIASCYLQHARLVSGSWVGALVMYNSGYYGLTRLNNNARVPTETAQYVVSVLNTINQCY